MPAVQEVGYGPYDGKRLSIEVDTLDKRDIYFTDEKPIFLLHVENIGSEEFDDDLQWHFAFPEAGNTTGSCPVKLQPGEKNSFEIGDRLLAFPGTVALCLTIPPSLPLRGTQNVIYTQFHTLYTFEVYDRAVHKRAQQEKQRTLNLLKVTLIISVLTLGAVIAGILVSIFT